jgi:hypothetical protein
MGARDVSVSLPLTNAGPAANAYFGIQNISFSLSWSLQPNRSPWQKGYRPQHGHIYTTDQKLPGPLPSHRKYFTWAQHQSETARDLLLSKNGGSGRNRTGVDGVAVRCMTTLPPSLYRELERETGFEPATSTLARLRSTN